MGRLKRSLAPGATGVEATHNNTLAWTNSSKLADAAQLYGNWGWRVIPLTPKSKRPILQEWPQKATTAPATITTWWEDNPTANIGIATGPESGLLVLDIDGDTQELLGDRHLPPTVCQRTGKGWHCFFKWPEALPNRGNRTGLLEGVDVRGDGGFVVVTPSIHPDSGHTYAWAPGLAPGEVDLATPPEWLIELLSSTQQVPISSETHDGPIQEGKRNTYLASLAGSMRRKGFHAEAIEAALLETNEASCAPPLAESEVKQIAKSIGRYPPGSPPRGKLLPFRDDAFPDVSHDALALALSETKWATRALYVKEWGAWLFWTGARWEKDNQLAHMTEIRAFLRQVAGELRDWGEQQASELEDSRKPQEADRLRKWGKKQAKLLRDNQTRQNVEAMARSNADLAAPAHRFDRSPDLLGTPAGTVDLRQGELRPADPENYITCQTAVGPAPPGTSAPHWDQFLRRVTGGDNEMQAFLKRICGYALTGHTHEQKLLFFHGPGGNGKTVFTTTVRGLMGDYAAPAPAGTFLERTGERHPTDLASLRGTRLVIGSELQPGKPLDESMIKDLTGGEPVKARYMRQDFFEYVPEFTLVLVGNHTPSLKGVDDALRRRFLLVPFWARISDEERDNRLTTKLQKEWPAILRWAIDGAMEWYRDGLQPPAAVLEASGDYLDSEDLVQEFTRECLEESVGSFIPTRDLFRAFRDWAAELGYAPTRWTQKALTRDLAQRGYEIIHRRQGNGLLHFQLKNQG